MMFYKSLFLSLALLGGPQQLWVGSGGAPFSPVTHTYTSGSGTETIPGGATHCQVSVIGAGGSGGIFVTTTGGGGAGGADAESLTFSCSGNNTFIYGVGGGGGAAVGGSGTAGSPGTASSVSAGTPIQSTTSS